MQEPVIAASPGRGPDVMEQHGFRSTTNMRSAIIAALP
jgi:hypothetical protein